MKILNVAKACAILKLRKKLDLWFSYEIQDGISINSHTCYQETIEKSIMSFNWLLKDHSTMLKLKISE